MVTNTDIWNYGGSDDWSSMDVVGYKVEATDGDIGKVDEKSNETEVGYLVVDTGPWILGKKVMLPAGVISRSTPPPGRSSWTGPRTRSRVPRSSTRSCTETGSTATPWARTTVGASEASSSEPP